MLSLAWVVGLSGPTILTLQVMSKSWRRFRSCDAWVETIAVPSLDGFFALGGSPSRFVGARCINERRGFWHSLQLCRTVFKKMACPQTIHAKSVLLNNGHFYCETWSKNSYFYVIDLCITCHTTIQNINHIRVDSGFLALVLLLIVLSCNVFRCASKQINNNKAVYDGTSLWSLLWFCHANIDDWSNFGSMTDDKNVSNEWYSIVWSAFICCFTTLCTWRSSWPLPLFNEGALTLSKRGPGVLISVYHTALKGNQFLQRNFQPFVIVPQWHI